MIDRNEARRIRNAWCVLQDALGIAVIHNDRQYRRMVRLADSLVDQTGGDEDHPLATLLEIVGALLEQYERDTLPDGKATPRDVLAFLMQEHGLRQSDLRAEVGTQGVVSEVLAGKRAINARQARALAQRFGVSPSLFI